MGGGGRPRSANAERGTVVVDGTTFEYTLYTGKKRSRWQIKFCEPGQKQITADFKNGDEDDEPTMVLRIREKLARMRAAAAEAPAPAPAQEPSPFRIDSLVGKRIEYLTWVGFPNGGEAKHWFAGLVEQVSDGTVRKGPRAKACHAAGFARILWDAQPALGEHEPTESWVALRPNKFNGDAKCCWRLDLD